MSAMKNVVGMKIMMEQQLEPCIRKPTRPAPVGVRRHRDQGTPQSLEEQLRSELKAEQVAKERALQRIKELEQTLRIVERQLDQFQGRQMTELAARRQAALEYYRQEYHRADPVAVSSGCPNADEGTGYDTVDMTRATLN
jgi:hypothetical protein